MKKKRTVIWMIILTMLLSILQVAPILANVTSTGLQVGDYVKWGTYKGKDMLWKVEKKDTQYGTLLVLQNKANKRMLDLEDLEEIGDLEDIEALGIKIFNEVEGRIKEGKKLEKGISTAFYLNEELIAFKTGEGKKENPYMLYTHWQGLPDMVANKDKIVLNGVELVGKADATINFAVQVDGIPRAITQIQNDKLNQTITLQLASAIKEGQWVTLQYDLPSDALVAIAKAGEKMVIKQIPTTTIVNETVDAIIPNRYTITTAANPSKGGYVEDNSIGKNGVYNENDMATVTAVPRSGYKFVSWTENGKEVSWDRSYTFKVTGNRNLIANYKHKQTYVPQYTIYVEEYPSDGGTVTGDYTYNEGEYATLKAKPKAGYTFESWTEDGKVVSRDSEYSFTVEENRWLEANFEEERPRERSFKEEWRSLSSKEQRAIKENFREYLPYTTIEESLSLSQLEDLTNGKFTEKQLREVSRDMELLEDVGIDLDWEVISLERVSRPYFTDMKNNHWAYEGVIELAKRGIVTGYPDQTFKPNKELTTPDTFTFLDRVLLENEITEVDLSRSTVEEYINNKAHWAFGHVASISAKLSEGTVKDIERLGNRPMTRELLAQVLYEVTDGKLDKTDKLVVFTDTLYSPYEKAIDYCITRGLLKGTSAYTMSPNKPVTRAEMMTILSRLDSAIKNQ